MPEEALNIFNLLWDFLTGPGGLLVGTAMLADVIRVLLAEASKLLPKLTFTYQSVPRWLKMTVPFLAAFIVAQIFNPLDPEQYAHPIGSATIMLGVGSAFAHALYKPLIEKLNGAIRNREEV